MVVLFFTALSAAVGLLTNSTSFLSNFILIFNGGVGFLSPINRLVSMAQIIISTIQTVLLLFLGLSALKKKDIPLGPLDKPSETIEDKTEE